MPGMLGIAHQRANFTKQNCILLRKTRSKILCSSVDSDFAPQNKEDYMLDVCLLGTAGMMPLPHRWLTASLMRYNGSSLLIDCGEGTQITSIGLKVHPFSLIAIWVPSPQSISKLLPL